MPVLNRCICLPIATMSIVFTGIAAAASPDPLLLSLMPHGAQIVAGTSAPPSKDQSHSFLLFTLVNAMDLQDFRSLMAVDDAKFFRQVFLAAGQKDVHSPIEHSVLAVGRFHQDRVYKAAIHNGARPRDYRGIAIVEVPPFSRNPRTFSDIRWMAILQSDLALFGTIANVREEIDRYQDHTPADSWLLERLARLRADDATWYLMPRLVAGDRVRPTLAALSPHLLDEALEGAVLQFGIHYGKTIRLDYEFTGVDPEAAESMFVAEAAVESRRLDVWTFVPTFSESGSSGSLRGVITISKQRYNRWMADVAAQALRRKHVEAPQSLAEEEAENTQPQQ